MLIEASGLLSVSNQSRCIKAGDAEALGVSGAGAERPRCAFNRLLCMFLCGGLCVVSKSSVWPPLCGDFDVFHLSAVTWL